MIFLLLTEECDGSAIEQLNEILKSVDPVKKTSAVAIPNVAVDNDDKAETKDGMYYSIFYLVKAH